MKTIPRFPLSRLMIGTAQFGLDYGVANHSGIPGFMEICAMLKEAASAGINCLDTAAGYGSSEEVIGRALAETGLKDFFFVQKGSGINY
jgi:aryl-alcohol dehydrogenase-like predicted oxidoreductase